MSSPLRSVPTYIIHISPAKANPSLDRLIRPVLSAVQNTSRGHFCDSTAFLFLNANNAEAESSLVVVWMHYLLRKDVDDLTIILAINKMDWTTRPKTVESGLGVGDGIDSPPNSGEKVFLGQTSCNIWAVDKFSGKNVSPTVN